MEEERFLSSSKYPQNNFSRLPAFNNYRQNIYFSDIALANMGKTTAQPESIRLLDWMKGCHLRQTASFVFNSRIHQNALIPSTSTSSAAGDRGSATTGSQLRHRLYPSVPQPHHSPSVHRPRVVLHTSPMPINGPRFSNHFDRHPPPPHGPLIG